MPISFIQQRISQLDSYLSNLDSKVAGRGQAAQTSAQSAISRIESKFDNILGNAISRQVQNSQRSSATTSQTTVQAKQVVSTSSGDDLSKLPAGFEDFIDKTTSEVSKQYGVSLDSNFVKAVIKQESAFNPEAVSSAGAEGLMQLMPATAKGLGVFNSKNPYQNVKGGITYLAQQLQTFGDKPQLALAAYNAGPQAVKRYGDVPPFQETQHYVQNIMKDYLRRDGYQPIDVTG